MSMLVPSTFIDVSQFRTVPDHQEVFADQQPTDQNLIVEILESAPYEKHEALRYHFAQVNEINEPNKAPDPTQKQREIHELEAKDMGCVESVYLLEDVQELAKFDEGRKGVFNVVRVMMALMRVPKHECDVLITFNVPEAVHPESSSSMCDSGDTGCAKDAWAVFKQMAASFRIDSEQIFG
ncbi:hypothetical protein BX661DRAFT_200765 [Kickxella alabastrina]|uniref:uncharacterized protein n=1 Tax=Kickxella alabastrina TaxID=61397 RepID=UPI0022206B1E|nr:uncharacterized protein BX661DRAFT_200765 [Kickxella alabastrina]KAI7821299.1 hypothetical protein BX661DRAFT_200765 [Kickxella alabastrina]